MNLRDLSGYHIEDRRHGLSIFQTDFADECAELMEALDNWHIYAEEIIAGGGGLTPIVGRLRDRLYTFNWPKKHIHEQYIVNEVVKNSKSHEIDHFRESSNSGVALEIEWNNKDTFFDRDLSNYERLHQLNAISLGILVTRGPRLDNDLFDTIMNWVNENLDDNRDAVYEKVPPHKISTVERQNERDPGDEALHIAKAMFSSKYASTTTNWEQLINRIERDEGYPAPIILIGIEPERVIAGSPPEEN